MHKENPFGPAPEMTKETRAALAAAFGTDTKPTPRNRAERRTHNKLTKTKGRKTK